MSLHLFPPLFCSHPTFFPTSSLFPGCCSYWMKIQDHQVQFVFLVNSVIGYLEFNFLQVLYAATLTHHEYENHQTSQTGGSQQLFLTWSRTQKARRLAFIEILASKPNWKYISWQFTTQDACKLELGSRTHLGSHISLPPTTSVLVYRVLISDWPNYYLHIIRNM